MWGDYEYYYWALKTITELSRWREELNKTFMAKQTELEALESNRSIDVVASEEGLCSQVTIYIGRFPIGDAKGWRKD